MKTILDWKVTQPKKRKRSRKLDCTTSASQTNSDLNVPDSFLQLHLLFAYSFSFHIRSPLGFSSPKLRFPQYELSSLVPVIANRDLANRLWRTVELPLWDRPIFGQLNLNLLVPGTTVQTQLNALNTHHLRWSK